MIKFRFVTEMMEHCESLRKQSCRGYYITVLCVAQSDWWLRISVNIRSATVVHREEQEEWENHTFGAL